MTQDNVHYFKRNVNLTVSVRFFPGDRDGIVLNRDREVVEVLEPKLKDFKAANKNAIIQGLIKEVPEPIFSWETANALDDNDLQALLSNFLKLKSGIQDIDSVPILYRLLELAKEKGSAKRITTLIESRIAEVEPEVQDFSVDRAEMGGSYDIGSIVTNE